jgi:hypothetical protein
MMGCEGDQGPPGPPGANGTNGTNGSSGTSVTVCMECHNDAVSLQTFLEYARSGHKAGVAAAYAGGRASCARCHSKQGFIEYAALGDVSDDFENPAPIDCATCHVVHPNAFGMRLSGAVALISDPSYSLDFGDNSNLCANCHQSRRPEPNIDAPADSFTITSTHYGPHHGPQAIVLEGVGFAEIPGSVAYPAPITGSVHLNAGVTCVTCHMAENDDGRAAHSWHPLACTECHAVDLSYIQDEVQAKLDNLRDLLVGLGVVEYVEADGAYEPVVGTYPMIQAQGFFNWIGLTEDRSLGVHNPSYVRALLDNSIEALTSEGP